MTIAALILASLAQAAPPVPPMTTIMIEEADPVVRPTLAMRAVAVESIDPPLTADVTFTLHCRFEGSGTNGGCVETDGPPLTSWAAFNTARGAQIAAISGGGTSSPQRTAHLLAQHYRLAALPMDQARVPRSVVIRLTLSRADVPTATGTPPTDPGELVLTPGSLSRMARFYPPAAMRASASALTTARCRVLADYSLWCRDVTVSERSHEGQPRLDDQFARATVRMLATVTVEPRTRGGADSAGLEFDNKVRWALAE